MAGDNSGGLWSWFFGRRAHRWSNRDALWSGTNDDRGDTAQRSRRHPYSFGARIFYSDSFRVDCRTFSTRTWHSNSRHQSDELTAGNNPTPAARAYERKLPFYKRVRNDDWRITRRRAWRSDWITSNTLRRSVRDVSSICSAT